MAGTGVYPILPGKVVHVNHTTSSQLGSVTLNHDIDGNGTYDNYYVKYLHIDPEGNATTGIKVGEEYDVIDVIGVVDTQKAGGFGPHLHFQRIDSTDSNTYKLINFYRSVSQWNYGSHLDFLSDDVYSANMFFITAYAATDNATNIYDVTGIDLYYKINSSGTWQKSSTGFSLFIPSTHRWTINLYSATGGSVGDTIYFYVVANRATDPTFSGTYKPAFFPQYYSHPSAPLSAANANTIARTRVLQ